MISSVYLEPLRRFGFRLILERFSHKDMISAVLVANLGQTHFERTRINGPAVSLWSFIPKCSVYTSPVIYVLTDRWRYLFQNHWLYNNAKDCAKSSWVSRVLWLVIKLSNVLWLTWNTWFGDTDHFTHPLSIPVLRNGIKTRLREPLPSANHMTQRNCEIHLLLASPASAVFDSLENSIVHGRCFHIAPKGGLRQVESPRDLVAAWCNQCTPNQTHCWEPTTSFQNPLGRFYLCFPWQAKFHCPSICWMFSQSLQHTVKDGQKNILICVRKDLLRRKIWLISSTYIISINFQVGDIVHFLQYL